MKHVVPTAAKPVTFPAEIAGKVNAAALDNFKLDRVIDELRTYQREKAALARRYSKAADFNHSLAAWEALRLLGQVMGTDFTEAMDVFAHELRVTHDHDPDEGMAWSDVPVAVAHLQCTEGMSHVG